jgi:hypothetical protein
MAHFARRSGSLPASVNLDGKAFRYRFAKSSMVFAMTLCGVDPYVSL